MKGKKKILIAILCMSAVMNAFMAVSPILAEVGKSFPEAGSSQVQMVYTIGSLVALPIMLVAGRLANYVPKKYLTIVGMVVMLVGGMLPQVMHEHLWQLYVASGVIGFGMAFINIISSTLISDHFTGLSKGAVMGYQSAAVSIGGALTSYVSGYIAANGTWVHSYLAYLIILPAFLVVLFLLPKDKVVSPEEAAATGGGKVIHGRLIFFSILGFFCSVFVNYFNSNIAMFLDKTGLGNAEVSGTVGSIFMLIGIPAGLLLGTIIKKLRRNTVGIMALCIACGMACVASAQSLVLVYVGAFMVGFGFAVRNPSAITFAANMVPAASAGLGIAFLNSFGQIGNFLSPLIINAVADLLGGNVRTTFIVCACGLLVLGIIYLAFNPVKPEEVG